jgi:hypothetical protein
MKKTFALFAASLGLLVALAACSPQPEPPAPRPPTESELRTERLSHAEENQKVQNMLEQNRQTAMNNIVANVSGYFALNPRFQPASDWRVIPHTDDYIDPACPQGSGWGWANIMNAKLKDESGQPTKIRVYCSTSSSALGCYVENDFKAGPHFKEAARCNENLPSPLKPISG